MVVDERVQDIVVQLEEMATSATVSQSISAEELRCVLQFISKVIQVLDGVYEDMFAILLDFKYLTDADVLSGRLMVLRKNLDSLRAKSHFRDAEEICSRLRHISMYYQNDVRPILVKNQIDQSTEWSEVLALIDEYEGKIMGTMNSVFWTLDQMISPGSAIQTGEINRFAAVTADTIHHAMDRLRDLRGQIMGMSGQPGLLELTGYPEALANRVQLTVDRRSIHVTGDIYSAGQAGAMGPNARAEHMTFQQIWNQQGGGIDLPALAKDLATLRDAMQKEATAPEHFVAVGQVAAAEMAAAKADGPTALSHLKDAGRWAFDVATKIGVGVATVALKSALGF
jgi:hypothetical protein